MEEITLDNILKNVSDGPELWKNTIATSKNIALAPGNTGDLERLQYLEELLIKTAKYYSTNYTK